MAALLLTAAVEAGEIRRGLKAPSPALGRVVPYSLYLPDSYGASAQRYPVLFLLHGLGGSEADWVTAGALGPTLDRLIAERAVPPMVVVAPGFGDSWYVDNPDRGGYGAAESAFLGDLVQHVDRTWSTAGRRTGRAVAGLSMGGWGAMRFAMLRPDLFVAAAGLSAAIVTADKATTEPWRGWFTGVFGTPFDPARLRAASPLALVPRLAASDPRPALFLTCGDDDELGLEEGSVLLHRALERAGVASELRVTDGGHGWAVWARELDPVLRFVGTALAGPQDVRGCSRRRPPEHKAHGPVQVFNPSRTRPEPGHGGPASDQAVRREHMPTKARGGGKSATEPKPGGRPDALQKPLQPSKELAAVVGDGPLPRGQVVSKVWDYIKKNDLQNPKDRREILADDKLERIFGKKKVTMFEMNKYLAQHLK